MKRVLRLLELVLLISLLLLKHQKAHAQISPCRTLYLDIGTGRDYESNASYSAGNSDQYWRISNGPTSAGIYPQCAVSSGFSYSSVFGNTSAIQLTTSGTVAGNMPSAINNCNYNDQPYLFERDFMVNTGPGNPSVNATLNIDQITADYQLSTIILSGPGGPFVIIPSCLGMGISSLPSSILSLSTGKYTLQVHVANEWASNAIPTLMRLQMKAYIYANQNIFVDNKHFGKHELCSPNYVIIQEPVLANTCVDATTNTTEIIIDNYQTGMNYSIQPPVSMTSLFTFNGMLGTTYTVTASDLYGCSLNNSVTVNTCMISGAAINMCIQGYALGNGLMESVAFHHGWSADSSFVDSVIVEWRQAQNPFNLVGSGKGMLHTDGELYVNFNPIPSDYYYMVLRYKNTLEAWSVAPLLLVSGAYYTISDPLNTAFAAHLALIDNNRVGLISGDLNQDGAIDAFDYLLLENDLIYGGNNLLSDLNGDGVTDSFDYLILDGNMQVGATSVVP